MKTKCLRGFIKFGFLIVGFFAVILIFVVTAYSLRNFIVATMLKSKLEEQLRTSVNINSIQLDLWNRTLSVRGIEIGNPEGFQHIFSIRMPEFRIALENPMKIENRWMISEMIIDINEIIIERNREGKFNLAELNKNSSNAQAPAEKKTSKKKADKSAQEPVEFKIGTLTLRVNQINYFDYRIADNPPRVSYNVNINETLRDSNSVEQIKERILQRIFSKIPLRLSDVMNPNKVIDDQKDKIKNRATDKLRQLF